MRQYRSNKKAKLEKTIIVGEKIVKQGNSN